jgi:GAF domain-containing protein
MAAAVVEAAEHVEATARVTEVISHVAQAVARELTLPAIVNVVLDQTTATLGARYVIVFLADDERRELRMVGHRDIPDDLAASLAIASYDAPMLAARAASTRRIHMASSVAEIDPELVLARQLMERTGSESTLALPLVAQGRLLGVQVYGLVERHEFSAEELAGLQTCAEMFAFGIRNATAFEEERRRRVLFETVERATVSIAQEMELLPVLNSFLDEARRTPRG